MFVQLHAYNYYWTFGLPSFRLEYSIDNTNNTKIYLDMMMYVNIVYENCVQ